MKKRVFIIHGWAGHPQDDWFTWLKKELENKGFEVYVPQMPETDNPRIYNWVPVLQKIVKAPDEKTYFVGHSMGNQTIARYLESLSEGLKIGGVIFVAGFFKRLVGLNEEEKLIANHWLETPINLKKIKSHFDKSIAIFSDNDPFVSDDNQEDFKRIFGSKIIIEHNNRHFNSPELPIVLESVLKISK